MTTDNRCNHVQVLSVAGNRLRALPCEIGWLGLKQLNISENPDLNIPEHVMHCGFRCAITGTTAGCVSSQQPRQPGNLLAVKPGDACSILHVLVSPVPQIP